MATVSVRIDDALQLRIEEAAAGQGTSVSEWIRHRVVASLGLEASGDWSVPSTLSKRERQQLALLHRIAELVATDEDEAEYHAGLVKVLEHGFTGEYSSEFIS